MDNQTAIQAADAVVEERERFCAYFGVEQGQWKTHHYEHFITWLAAKRDAGVPYTSQPQAL